MSDSFLHRRAVTALGIAVKTLRQIAEMPYAGKKGNLALATLAFLNTQTPELVPSLKFPKKKKRK